MKRILPILFFCFYSISPINAALATNNSKATAGTQKDMSSAEQEILKNPDFAYPQTVSGEARKIYDDALKHRQPLTALRAAMECAVADNLVTTDSVTTSLERFRHLAKVLPAPYSGIATLLEATLLGDIYRNGRRIIDQRTLPLDDLNSDPRMWSGEQFRYAIGQNVRTVIDQQQILASTPISAIAPLVDNADRYEKAGMSMLDFAIYRLVSILNPISPSFTTVEEIPDAIPFINEEEKSFPVQEKDKVNTTAQSAPMPIDLLEMLIKTDEQSDYSGSEALLIARLNLYGLLGKEANTKYGYTLLSLYPDSSEWRPTVVLRLAESGHFIQSNEDEKHDYYQFLLDTADAHPDSPASKSLREIAEEFVRPFVNISASAQILPEKPSSITYSVENLETCHLLLVALDKNMKKGNLLQKNLPRSANVTDLGDIGRQSLLPWHMDGEVSLPPLKPGYYAIVPSSTDNLKGLFPSFKDYNVPIINVSNLSLVAANGSKGNEGTALATSSFYVTDAMTGCPVEGAEVECIDRNRNNNRNKSGNGSGNASSFHPSQVTNKEGMFKCNISNAICTARFKGSSISEYIQDYSTNPNFNNSKTADILTDLAIYHPGDEVNALVVVSRPNQNRLSPAPGTPIEISLLDANYYEVSATTTTTDPTGRATASFRIPDDRLTGTYQILVVLDEEGEQNGYPIGRKGFEVAEYKAPVFKVSLVTPAVSGDTLEISGAVATNAGLPLADTEVTLTIDFQMSWWRMFTENMPTNYSCKVMTGNDGRFLLSLGIGNLYGTLYEAGYFNVNATATSENGETESSQPQSFAIAQGYHMEMDNQTVKAEGEAITLPVKVVDALGKPVRKEMTYTITDDKDAIIASGSFFSPQLDLKASAIPSGRYMVTAILQDARKEFDGPYKGKLVADTVSAKLTVWRPSDKQPPFDTPLWIPETKIRSTSEAGTMEVTVGSSYQGSMIFYQVADCNSIISQGFLKASASNQKLRVPVPQAGNRISILLRGIHDLREQIGKITILPAAENRKLELVTETFRDRIDPGSHEKWIFRFNRDNLPVKGAAVMAVMSDAALNAITPFRWSLNPYRNIYYNIQGGLDPFYPGMRSLGGYTTVIQSSPRPGLANPEFNLWGYPLYANTGRMYERKLMATASGCVTKESLYGSMAVTSDSASFNANVMESVEDMAMEKEQVASEAGSQAGSTDTEDIPLRDTEHPLAFFRPLLTTGEDGMVEIAFDAPDFNTTWALQLLAYDEEMRSAYLSEEVVAAKPVIISTNMPRFLLTGDRTDVAATMYNNSDERLTLNGRIEIIDPTTGRVIAFSDSGDTEVEPSANVTFTSTVSVPMECNSIIIRSVVRSKRGSDGEQDIIPVLPSSQPVLDATTFYLTPTDNDLSVRLPKMGKEDMVTLNYCANPAWFVLTTLSGFIKPDSESTLVNLNALYANQVSGGLLERYPTLRKGLQSLFDGEQPDSLLTSPLEKNSDQKLTTLQNTPWVNNAKSETDRMQGLLSLTDSEKYGETIKGILERLARNQTSDGSFLWMPQMREGSLWITLNFLDCAAAMKSSGYALSDQRFETMVTKALGYTDLEVGKSFRESEKVKKGTFPLSTEMTYLLNRSQLTNKPTTGEIARMEGDMLRRIPKEWRELSVAYKILAARILKREGKMKLAREIMESVKQNASYKPDKGMWFDNLRGSLFSPSSKYVTALAVQALNEIMPGDEAILRMCRYLVLSRQTEDWNLDMSPAAVTMTANAVLGSDIGWTDMENSAPPVITLDGVTLELSEAQALTGDIWIDLDATKASGALLSVSRQADVPAWGGVLRQYVAPAKDVKAHSVSQLKVTKQLLPIEQATGGEKAAKTSTRFSKGDLVRVTLTLVTDRDLDYVLINDRRGAFMQPADQLTEYTAQNGLWILRETRNSATNFYITRLPKGQYILTYDVYADRDGEYSTGIATAQSQYYPLITAHSAGCLVTVEN